MHTISALAGVAFGVSIGALAVLVLARFIRLRDDDSNRPPPSAIVRLYIDEDDMIRLGRHPAGAALTASHSADVEVAVRDTRPRDEDVIAPYVHIDGVGFGRRLP